MFRVDTLAASPDEMDRAGDPDGSDCSTPSSSWGTRCGRSRLGGPGIDAMLNTAWRVPGEATGEVFGAVGGHHPDKDIAKAARKALFRYRSAA